jgi:thiamine-monophosphate kinase
VTGRRTTEAGVIALVRSLTEARARPGVQVGIGDDCAVLEFPGGGVLLATTDLLLENVHFRRAWAAPADIGWKAMAVNLSDIASMGGAPRWALVALACPEDTRPEEVAAFFDGALAIASEHGVAIVGGDTAASQAGWIVNVTLLGEAPASPLRRSGGRPGDVVAVTGALGAAAAGLALLERGRPPVGLAPEQASEATRAHLRPRPRVVEGRWLATAGGVTAMMDLSDGLATDLPRLATESRVGARIDVSRLPIAPTTRAVALAVDVDPLDWATGGGEDYELLLTCERGALARLADGLRAATGTVLSAIGEVVTGEGGVGFHDAAGRPVRVRAGFEHFAVETPGV